MISRYVKVTINGQTVVVDLLPRWTPPTGGFGLAPFGTSPFGGNS